MAYIRLWEGATGPHVLLRQRLVVFAQHLSDVFGLPAQKCRHHACSRCGGDPRQVTVEALPHAVQCQSAQVFVLRHAFAQTPPNPPSSNASTFPRRLWSLGCAHSPGSNLYQQFLDPALPTWQTKRHTVRAGNRASRATNPPPSSRPLHSNHGATISQQTAWLCLTPGCY